MINVPTADMAAKVVGIGNCSGRDTDKFAKFGLTAVQGAKVVAPLISECYANFECRLHDASLVNKYSLFVLGGREGPRGAVPAVPAHAALPRRRRVHDLRHQHPPLPAAVQAGDAVSGNLRFDLSPASAR